MWRKRGSGFLSWVSSIVLRSPNQIVERRRARAWPGCELRRCWQYATPKSKFDSTVYSTLSTGYEARNNKELPDADIELDSRNISFVWEGWSKKLHGALEMISVLVSVQVIQFRRFWPAKWPTYLHPARTIRQLRTTDKWVLCCRWGIAVSGLRKKGTPRRLIWAWAPLCTVCLWISQSVCTKNGNGAPSPTGTSPALRTYAKGTNSELLRSNLHWWYVCT